MRSSLLAAAVAAVLLAACSSQPPAPEKSSTSSEAMPGGGATSSGVGSTSVDPYSVAALKDPKSPLSKRNIYFDYDSFVVKDEYKYTLEQHGKFLSINKQMKMLIQGNADERGSREYNLALGQKRAEAVKKVLLLNGATESQIEAVSLGKEKPKCSEHTEDCWAQNRRADILYTGEY